ncbi:MAG: hypothetical protein F6K22_04875 [Okeania sp. SIO2F4]|uniref:hypothetical protein n=1 Tax=Okeania sp. SIO2F4 TaxID=2607790 RepID=UPI00142C5AA9|nr:hypothetical protein [Okeania sp. SIO2F4]NES02225.1 hypothetical protein [Okeania sp. SIO2F4]
MSNNPAPRSLLPTPYSQGDVATLLKFGIRQSYPGKGTDNRDSRVLYKPNESY